MGSEHGDDERATVELGGSAGEHAIDPMDDGDDDMPSGGEPSEPLGLESEVALARARGRLVGREPIPVTVGRYRILERRGRGGMGVVYAAHDDELDRVVAIKILHAKVSRTEDGRRRLHREAQAMARLSHPNVGHVYEVGRHGDQVFLAMELVPGVTLRQWCTGKSWRDVLRVHVAAGEGLAAAHAVGLVHRDYKCENVLVGDDGRPRVLDFGLARPDAHLTGPTIPIDAASSGSMDDGRTGPRAALSMSDEITRAGTVIGTPAYMAPEQLAGNVVDARADQFSFCVALFECLYGQRPFRGSTVSTLVEVVSREAPAAVDVRAAGVPAAVHAAILRGLRPEPTRRHANMDELLAILRLNLEARPRSRRAAVFAAAAAVSVLAAGAALELLPSASPTAATELVPMDGRTDGWEEIIASSELPPVIEQPLVGDPTAMTVHRLANGLTVYVASRPGEPFIEAQLVIRATIDDEAPGEDGMSGLALWAIEAGSTRLGTLDFERERPHLERQHELIAELALETSEPAREEIMRRIAAAQEAAKEVANPSELHAVLDQLGVRDQRTAITRSILAADVPRNRFDAFVAVSAEMLRRPVFRNFASVAASKLEIDRHFAENDIAYRTASKLLPRGFGYEDPQLAAQTLRRLPLAEVRRFHETYYRPNNAAIVLVGDITPAEALPVIEAAFGDWEPASVPKPVVADGEPTGKRLIEVEDGGPPSVHLVWPLPPPSSAERPAYDDLAAALGGPDGVLARVLHERGVELEPELESWPNLFAVIVHPHRGVSLAQAESALFDALQMIANDDAPDDAWTRALARQELEASRWASSADALANLVSDSFSERRAWADVAAHLARPAASRTALVAAAQELLARGVLVIHQKSGEPSTLAVEPLPFTPPGPDTKLGPWGRALLDSPVTPLEPQFLAAGRHFDERRRGGGRVITTKGDGPLFRLEWVFPTGVASNPWACDAVRAQIRAHQRDEGLRGLDIHATCRAHETSVHVLGVASRLDEAWPGLAVLLVSGAPDGDGVRDHIDETLGLRAQVRTHGVALSEALHSHALFGTGGVDGGMPDDATLRRQGPAALPRAWAAMLELDPDVLYVGPRPDRLRELLPAPRGKTAPPAPPLAFRTLERPTVFLLEDPGRESADVRVALVPPGTDARSRLLGQMFDAYPAIDPEPDGTPWHRSGLAPIDAESVQGRSVHLLGYRCASRDVPRVLAVALRTLRVAPTREGFAIARDRLESRYRGFRIPAVEVPAYVRTWPQLGSTVDPRLEPWLALGGIDYESFVEHTRQLASVVPIVSVLADPADLDEDTLALHGEIVRVPIDALLRDPELDDMRVFEYPPE